MIKMGKNEEDILLEAEDKIATLKTIIADWNKAADNADKIGTRQRPYCLGRVHGLETCLPLIKKLVADYDSAEIGKLLEEID